MKKLLLICFFVLSISNSFAISKWEFATKGVNNDVIYVDMNSFQRSGDSITFWMMSNYDKRTEYGDLSTKSQITINCRTRERIYRYMMFYDDTNNNGRLTSQSNPVDAWTPIAPETMMWSVYMLVCKR